MTKRVTLVDIAKKTGFSVNSVSRALMDASDISDKTKAIIKKTADEMGYVPNIAAASLKNGNSKIIGILYDDLLNPYYNSVIHYLEEILSERDYSIITYRSLTFDVEEFNNIISRNLEGLITFLPPTDEVEKRIKIQKFPTVVIGRKAKMTSSVYADDLKIGNIAAQAIVNRNCKHPIYIGDDIEISKMRAEGFSLKLKELDINHELYFYQDQASIYDVLDQAFEINEIDSIFCFSDLVAFKVLRHLSKNKINNIVVVGVDNVQNEIPFPMDFITIGQDKEKIANKVIDLLFNQKVNIDSEVQFIVEEVYLVENN